MNWLQPPTKLLRSKLIARYVRQAGYYGAVIFSCGNAARALKAELEPGLPVVGIAPGYDLKAERWWMPDEIRRLWPHMFDATAGHLPMPLMVQLAQALADHLGPLTAGTYHVPTGSGETVLCLRWAYPHTTFVAVYDSSNPATMFEKHAPLTPLVVLGGAVMHADCLTPRAG